MGECERVHCPRLSGACVLDHDNGIAVFVRRARGRLDPDVGRDAANDDRAHATSAELQVQLRTVEGAPLTLGDADVGGFGEAIDNIRPAFGETFCRWL